MSNSDRLIYSAARASAIALTALAAACGGGGGSSTTTTTGGGTTTTTYTVSGTVSGLTTGASVVLSDNGNDSKTVSANGSFSFGTAITTGGAYAVTVGTQPAGESCTVANGSGTISANVTNVTITCSATGTTSYTIAGSVSGLASGASVVLQDNGGDNKTVNANGIFSFATPIASGGAYAVTVGTQPTGQNCTVTNGSGTASANVSNVSVTCSATNFTVGGTITGLTGTGLVLQDNGSDNLTVTAAPNGAPTPFTFNTSLATGTAYAVTVSTQPSGPAQICSVTSAGTGNITSGNVTSVAITCLKVGQYVYVVNKNGSVGGSTGDVSAFTINQSTGALTAVGTLTAAGTQPTSAAVDTTGQYLYVGNKNSANVTRFLIQADGSLGATHTYVTSQTGVATVVINPADNLLYAGGYGPGSPAGNLYGFTLDNGTGGLSPVPNSPYGLGNATMSMAIDPAGKFLFAPVPSHFLYAFDIGADGSLATTAQQIAAGGPTSTDNAPYGVVAWPGGTASGGYVYVSDETNGDISMYKYDAAGALTELTAATLGCTPAPACGSPFDSGGNDTRGLAIDPLGQYLYATNYADGKLVAFSINAQTGALTAVGPVGGTATGNLNSVANPGPLSLRWDPSGQWLYCTNYLDGSVSVFTAQQGVLTLRGTIAADAGTQGIAVY